MDTDDDIVEVMEGNPKDEHPFKQNRSLRKQQTEHLLNMTESLHDYNEGCDDFTKEPNVNLPFIAQQDGTTNNDKGDITEYADEVGIKQIIDQEDKDISYGLTSEENTETNVMLWKTVEEDIIKGTMENNVLEVGFTRRDKISQRFSSTLKPPPQNWKSTRLSTNEMKLIELHDSEEDHKLDDTNADDKHERK